MAGCTTCARNASHGAYIGAQGGIRTQAFQARAQLLSFWYQSHAPAAPWQGGNPYSPMNIKLKDAVGLIIPLVSLKKRQREKLSSLVSSIYSTTNGNTRGDPRAGDTSPMYEGVALDEGPGVPVGALRIAGNGRSSTKTTGILSGGRRCIAAALEIYEHCFEKPLISSLPLICVLRRRSSTQLREVSPTPRERSVRNPLKLVQLSPKTWFWLTFARQSKKII